MYELKIDELSKILEKEEPEGVDFFLMADERPYNGIESHRAAILFVFYRFYCPFHVIFPYRQ